MRHPEYQYLRILRKLVDKAKSASQRDLQRGPQDVAAVNIGLTTMRFDLSRYRLPLLTTKKMPFKSIAVELLWFLRGESTLDFLHQHGVHFWDPWAAADVAKQYGLQPGDVGPTYTGWRNFPDGRGGTLDQIDWVVGELKDPEKRQWRRWRITMWQPGIVMHNRAILAPCHGDVHFIMVDGRLNLHHFQRSGDWFLGVPFNIASYALLLLMVCHVTGCLPGEFVQVTSDTHLYTTHIEAAEEQLKRKPFRFPVLRLDLSVSDIFRFGWPGSFTLLDYNYHPAIGAEGAL